MNNEHIQNYFGSVPYFADTAIESMNQETYKQPFTRLFGWCTEGAVNIQRVVGTMHPDYAGMTWRELLRKGRRMDANLKHFHDNPGYYTNVVHRRPSMHIVFIDGKGYVGEDGNHRTCIGRFYLYPQQTPFMYGIRMSEQFTDMRLLALYERLSRLLPPQCTVAPCSQEIRREDGDGWAEHEYALTLRLENRRRGYVAELAADEIEEGLLPVLHNPLNRFGVFCRFGTYSNLLT